MQIIIFEGLPTSGKTSLMKNLITELGKTQRVQVIDEDKTLMRVLYN